MGTKPQTFQGDLAHLPEALTELTEEERWLAWKWELRTTKGGKEKWTKPPYQPGHPDKLAKPNKRETWGTYSSALDAVQANKSDGIGYALLGSDVGAVDIDRVRDPSTNEVVRWARQLCEEATGAYVEVTVSGTGLRILGRVNGPELHRQFNFDRKTGAGVELYRNTPRYVTVSGLQVGTCAELPVIDEILDRWFARYATGGESATENVVVLDFNDVRRPYEEVIRNGCPEGERSKKFHSVVFHLAGQGWSVDRITDELGKHPNGIGAKYAKRLRREVERSYAKWQKEKGAAATGGPAPGIIPPPGIITPAPPQIIVVPGQLPRVVTEAEGALLRSGNELYQRGSLIVRPVLAPTTVAEDADGWHLIPVVRPYLVDAMTGAARFVHHDRRAKGFVPIDAPDKVAEVYLSRVGRWRMPNLVGIVNTPFLRPDGSICEKPGYDKATGILFKSDGTKFPPVPLWPSWANAMDALGELKRLTCTFPFVKPADWSVALSAILTTLDRRSLAHAPLHGFTAPTPRTGKSKLVDIVAVLATGRRMPVVAEGPDKRELEKRIGAELLAGRAVISIDNVQRPLSSSFLCQCLTQPRVDVRILGRSESPETPTSAAFFATGNNLVIADDLIGRCLLCSLDARCEHPELREFDEDAVELARRERGELVIAALTVLRAWLTAEDDERKKVRVKPLGGFEDWSYRIREPLVWLGESDPVETTFEAKKSDPAWEALTAVVTQWRDRLTVGAGFTVQQVIMRANGDQEFHTALMNVAASKTDESINNDRLGRWLKRVEGRPVEGVAFKKRGFSDGFPVWSLVTVD